MSFHKRFFILIACICAIFPFAHISEAASVSSSSPTLLFSAPRRGSKATELGNLINQEWKVLEVKYNNNESWYKVTINDKTGWLFGGAVYDTRMNLYDDENQEESDKYFEAVEGLEDKLFDSCKKISKGIDSDKNWLRRPDVTLLDYMEGEKPDDADPGEFNISTYAASDALLQLFTSEKLDFDALPISVIVSSRKESERFIGFPAIGMTEEQLMKKMSLLGNRDGERISYKVNAMAFFDFYIKNGLVYKVTYSSNPITQVSGAPMPERAYELRRMLDKPSESWPIILSMKNDGAKLYKEASFKAETAGNASDYYMIIRYQDYNGKEVDRGEKYPWHSVKAINDDRVNDCWVNGKQLDKDFYFSDSDEPVDYYMAFVNRLVKYFMAPPAALEKVFLGEPESKSKDEWKWPGITVKMAESSGGIAADGFIVTGNQVDIGGFRVGDPVSALDELLRGLKKRGSSVNISEGENVISLENGLSEITIVIKDGRIKSFECSQVLEE